MNELDMYFFETIIDKYFACRSFIWLIVSLLSIVIITLDMCLCKKHRKYDINSILNKVFTGLVFIGGGILFRQLELQPEINYAYFNVAIFMIIMTLIVSYGVVKSILYVNIGPLLHLCRYIQIGCLLELLLLAVTGFLEVGEALTGLLVIAATEGIVLLHENVALKSENLIDKESDYPNPQLFPTREKQLSNFVFVLKQQKKEPYAIMISGRWGIGKNSFVMALEERLKKESPQDCFIWVKTGSEKTVSEIVSQISNQIMDILRKNNIYLGHEDLVEKYFLAFSDILDKKGWGFWKKFASSFEYNGSGDGKDYVNSMLNKLKGTIYIVIDDLDRCSKDYKRKMFKVIQECTQLTNCKTIFLIDKAKFLGEQNEDSDIKYIKKYISYTLDLCEVDYEQIARFFADDIFDTAFMQQISCSMSQDPDREEFMEWLCKSTLDILERLETEFQKSSSTDTAHMPDNTRKVHTARVESLKNMIQETRLNIINPRTVKGFLKGIKEDILKIVGKEYCSGDTSFKIWFQAIIEVEFLKNFSPEEYIEAQLSESISIFGQSDNNYGAIRVFGLLPQSLKHEETKIIILDYLIFQVDIMEFSEIKTQRDTYLNELQGKNADISHIDKYLRYAQTCEDLSCILDVCRDQNFPNEFERENFIGQLLNIISEVRSPFRNDSEYFLVFSSKLIEYINSTGLTRKVEDYFLDTGEKIVNHVLLDNGRLFYCILSIAFKRSELNELWKNQAYYDINVFCSILNKLDKYSNYGKFADESDKIEYIKQYFSCIGEELTHIDDEDLKRDISNWLCDVGAALDICEYWHHIKDNLVKSEEKIFQRYFIINSDYNYRDSIFECTDNVVEALSELYNFYTSHQTKYKSEYSLILLRLSDEFVQICENFVNGNIFDNKKEEIALLLNKIASIVYKSDKAFNKGNKETINQIKVNVYLFNCYVEERKVVENQE